MSTTSAGDGAAAPAPEKFDFIVIGGGSGGLSAAKRAAELGIKVALFDLVKPTTHGTTWKLGGTCVNVGCIPKKLMHYSGLLKESFADARALGWAVPEETTFDWEKMALTVQNYVRSLNWGYRSELMTKKVKYINAYAQFVDPYTLKYELGGETKYAKAPKMLLAMGGRPRVPEIPGKELAHTSDDLFWMKKSPGKTLLIGASYISLELAGCLEEFGIECAVMVRSIFLRGMDQECANHVADAMEKMGMRFLRQFVPTRLEETAEGRIRVHYAPSASHESDDAKMSLSEEFDTVIFATGRKPDIDDMSLAAAGLKQEDNGKFNCNNEQTNVKHIYAVGDIVNGAPELTPVAIRAGKLLADRLYAGGRTLMQYHMVPTTVFTPVEYSFVGYSEDDCNDIYGAEDLEVYHQKATSLEWAGTHRATATGESFENAHFCKVVCVKSEGEKVVGFHYVGPNAGEVMQGFALALKLGCKKTDLDSVIGIHPTTAEWFTTLSVTKSSGAAAEASGC